MVSIISLLLILTLSVLVTRIATVMLTHTGLSREGARFQARSAFTGVGFTTSEAENVVNHPVRRKILQVLMLLGNAGVVTSMTSLIVTFLNLEDNSTMHFSKMATLFLGVCTLWIIASSSWVDRHLSALISLALNKYTRLEVKDYENLLNLSGEYSVSERYVEKNDWLADKTIDMVKPRKEGIAILGIVREDGTYIGVPGGSTKMVPGDRLILYGRTSTLEKLCSRRKGTAGAVEHDKAVAEQEEIARKEKKKDPAES